MDIQLPMMDGIECIRWIREVDKTVQIVIVSAYGEFNYAQKAIRYGVQEFLLKPVSRVMLNQIVNQVKENLDHREKNKESCFNNELAINLKEWVHGDNESIKTSELSREKELFRILIKDRGIKEHAETIKKLFETNFESWRIESCVLVERYLYLIMEADSENELSSLMEELENQKYHIELYRWSEDATAAEKQSFQNPDLEFDNYGFYQTKEMQNHAQ